MHILLHGVLTRYRKNSAGVESALRVWHSKHNSICKPAADKKRVSVKELEQITIIRNPVIYYIHVLATSFKFLNSNPAK